MKHIAILAGTLFALQAAAQDLPMPSPHAEVEQTIGLTEVEVTYSRPSARDRKVFGDLVPFDQLWRTGANKCTTVETDGPIVFGGTEVPAGTYSLFTVPGAEAWELVLNTSTELWGTDDYNAEQDVARVKVPVAKNEWTETFTISFDEVKDDKARMDLRWADVRVSVWIEANSREKAMANIQKAVADPEADFRVFNGCARYYIDNGIDPKMALEWAQKSVSMERKFWNLHTLALAQAANGAYKDAMATAEESMAMAQKAEYEPYVKMNKEKMDEWRMAMGKEGKSKGK
ncbi:MAG TPA: DUF2911 domain-containing protein [Flavobacteriales bacterium]|nr:DUF2911 domain-containing protein [Flavobacteriales bacterium]MCB0784276.1 DUF2911 domain-containing protein [Flavobacteriales bacterium]MCB0789135.1 DUF2911 domain-containing protein [Flavobacteriales bacterium]MCB0809507.1 DUF2911 domain-containing protein [Flavobacteriales bacterium]MCB0811641.1 DUF2911 domain-containing protein [Flavobacteriales bacterium]